MDGSSFRPPDLGMAMAERGIKKNDNRPRFGVPQTTTPQTGTSALNQLGIPPASAEHAQPDQPTKTIGLKDSVALFSPGAVAESVGNQIGFGGSKTQEQLQHEQQEAMRTQQTATQRQQEWQAQQARKNAERQQVQGQVESLKQQGVIFSSKKLFRSATTDADLSELSLVERSLKAAQEAKERKKKAPMLPKTTRKGPIGPGDVSKDQSQDAIQKMGELAAGE